ncbi:hypothetical protein PG984_005680 [Apiospora sp. TS-2023a]
MSPENLKTGAFQPPKWIATISFHIDVFPALIYTGLVHVKPFVIGIRNMAERSHWADVRVLVFEASQFSPEAGGDVGPALELLRQRPHQALLRRERIVADGEIAHRDAAQHRGSYALDRHVGRAFKHILVEVLQGGIEGVDRIIGCTSP